MDNARGRVLLTRVSAHDPASTWERGGKRRVSEEFTSVKTFLVLVMWTCYLIAAAILSGGSL